ncbi:MAG: hypothetical protein HY273_04450 [Gammaproteobacteria bacterium]|nr:hypothetical protein [Gammaproteobacteria bacterium]
MLSWNVDQGVIRELRMSGRNFILPWGIETADTRGFFSLEKPIGYRHVREVEHFHADAHRSQTETTVRMPEGYWALRLDDRIENARTLRRRASLTSLDDTVLMDFVMRFRFRKEFFPSAEIAGQTLRHRASDVYHQYPVRTARLNGTDFSVYIEVEEANNDGVLEPNLYVRDHANEWVVHARMVPRKIHKEVIKICNGWAGTRALPSWANSAVLAMPGVRSLLWYRNERRPYPRIVRRLFNPNAFPMALLAKGRTLEWQVRMDIV